MKYCYKCGNEMQDTDVFCKNCGCEVQKQTNEAEIASKEKWIAATPYFPVLWIPLWLLALINRKKSTFVEFHFRYGIVLYVAQVIISIIRSIFLTFFPAIERYEPRIVQEGIAEYIYSAPVFSPYAPVSISVNVMCVLAFFILLILEIIGLVRALKGEYRSPPIVGKILDRKHKGTT